MTRRLRCERIYTIKRLRNCFEPSAGPVAEYRRHASISASTEMAFGMDKGFVRLRCSPHVRTGEKPFVFADETLFEPRGIWQAPA